MTKDELGQLTWEEVRALDRGRTIAILPVGAIEAHGPHLPLETDGIIATAMARAGAAQLATRGHHAVLLPTLPYTVAGFAGAFPGTISITGAASSVLVVDIARSLTAHGFRLLAIANAHLDPEHLDALEAAVIMARRAELLPIVFPNLTRKPWGSRLGHEFRSGACHAGQFETSIVLAERPELVRESIRTGLDPNPRSLSTAIREGHQTFDAAGGPRAYFGDPRAADAAEGRRLIDILGGILEEAVLTELAT
ncbi:MAG: creatininase family protein [Gemmatimonadales bacterium]|nr:creatininase family protein [Gemmatimonadales bacterium]